MHIVSVKTLREFWQDHADAESALKFCFREARTATWTSFDDVRARFRSADVLPGNRVVFNIRGNNYRLIVHIHYNTGRLFIRFIGTHAEYNKINGETI